MLTSWITTAVMTTRTPGRGPPARELSTIAPAAYPQTASARKTQLSARAGRRWSRVTIGATIRWYLRAMMMRGSHQPPLRRGLSTLRWRA